MGKLEELQSAVAKIFANTWTTRAGRVVPEPEEIGLGNDAVEFERATILYADLQGSTRIVEGKSWQFSAEVYKTFLHCAASLINAEGGTITSYDGDRVMGIWVGAYQSTPAVKAGLKINYAVKNIVNPSLKRKYPSSNVDVKQVVGIDTSSIRAARTGVRGGNDIVWVGRAANYAAKLTDINMDERTWITDSVFIKLADEAKYGGDPKQLMWKRYRWTQQGDMAIHGSNWTWTV